MGIQKLKPEAQQQHNSNGSIREEHNSSEESERQHFLAKSRAASLGFRDDEEIRHLQKFYGGADEVGIEDTVNKAMGKPC